MDAELDLTRLKALHETLGAEVSEIARTLLDELDQAVEEIEGALARKDLGAAAQAAHAARNSALIIDAHPVLGSLRPLEAGARAGDPEAAHDGLEQLRRCWPPLRRRLSLIAQSSPP